MPFFQKIFQKISSNQQPKLVCTWSEPQSGSSPSLRRRWHTLTATANAASELLLFGGLGDSGANSDVYVFSTRDFSPTLLQTSGEVPTPRWAHCAALIGTKILICGGVASGGRELNHDSLYLLNLGTSDPFMSSPSPADHSFALQKRESGPTLWSMVPGRAVVATIPQTWSVPSSSSLVVGVGGRSLMICGHSI
jgi:hypothetical protein